MSRDHRLPTGWVFHRFVPGVCACAALCASLGGCHAPPSFSVTDVAMTAETEDAYVLTFTLLGENPTSEPYPLRKVSYSLTLDGARVFSATRSAQATIPARGAQAFTIPVSIPLASRGGGAEEDGRAGGTEEAGASAPPWGEAAEYRLAGSVEYLLPGSIAELLFDSRIRVPRAGFSESGTFRFDD